VNKIFINNYNTIYSEFSRQVVLTGIGLASATTLAYMLSKSIATTPEAKRNLRLGICLVAYAMNGGLREWPDWRYLAKVWQYRKNKDKNTTALAAI
jgi:hypothetical protein